MDTATRLIHEAIDLSDDGDYDGALEVLSRVIASDPRNSQAYFERGMALLNLERDEDALRDFDRALEWDPKYPGARDWRAKVFKRLGRHRDAAEDRLRNLHDHPDGRHAGMGLSPQDWADCAQSFDKAGDSATAKDLLEEYLTRHASRVTAYACYETAPIRLLVRLLVRGGEIRRARELAARAYASPHRVPADILTYAIVLEAAREYPKALAIIDEALAINGLWAEALELKRRLLKAK